LAWSKGGKIELMGVDAELGPLFYKVVNDRKGGFLPPERGQCIQCHNTAPAKVLSASVIPFVNGVRAVEFLPSAGHETSYVYRFGGWLVDNPLLATNVNCICAYGNPKTRVELHPSVFKERLSKSDMTALLLHEHQAGFVNRVTELMRKYGPEMPYRISGSYINNIDSVLYASDDLRFAMAAYILFSAEPALPDKVVPLKPFVEQFMQRAVRDSKGRSLRDLDLESHLLKYRCSYMIYTEQWQRLNKRLKHDIYETIKAALNGENPLAYHLPLPERQAIMEIMRDTVTDLPEGW
jgi:hypothetical protein